MSEDIVIQKIREIYPTAPRITYFHKQIGQEIWKTHYLISGAKIATFTQNGEGSNSFNLSCYCLKKEKIVIHPIISLNKENRGEEISRILEIHKGTFKMKQWEKENRWQPNSPNQEEVQKIVDQLSYVTQKLRQITFDRNLPFHTDVPCFLNVNTKIYTKIINEITGENILEISLEETSEIENLNPYLRIKFFDLPSSETLLSQIEDWIENFEKNLQGIMDNYPLAKAMFTAQPTKEKLRTNREFEPEDFLNQK